VNEKSPLYAGFFIVIGKKPSYNFSELNKQIAGG